MWAVSLVPTFTLILSWRTICRLRWLFEETNTSHTCINSAFRIQLSSIENLFRKTPSFVTLNSKKTDNCNNQQLSDLTSTMRIIVGDILFVLSATHDII